MPEPATNHPKNKELRLHLASVLYFMSRVAVAGFVFAVPAVYFIRGHVEMPVVLGGAALVTLLFVSYYLAASGLRCAACSNPVLMDNGTRKHPHAKRFPGLSHRTRVAWDILFNTNYLCMYCNTRCRCKKSWSSTPGTGAGAPTGRPTAAAAQSNAGNSFPESVFSSVFGGIDIEPQHKTSPVGRFPGAAEEDEVEEAIISEPKPATGRVVTPSSKTESIFPDTRTAPVAVEPEPPIRSTAPAWEKKEETAPVPAPSILDEPRTPLPWEMPPPRRASAESATVPVLSKTETAPQPAAISESNDFTQNTPAMNNHAPERTAAPLPSNPFLAAAAAQPPPPGPPLPVRPNRQPAAETTAAPAFPTAGTAEPADGPPPWTLPSIPRPSAPPAITAPVLPIIPDTAASLARRPHMGTSPVPVPPPSAFGSPHPSTAPVAPPAPPVMTSLPAAAAMPPAPAAALPASLIKDVVGVLEEGQRSLTSAFQSIIEKLESRLTASAAATAPPAAVIPPPAPVLATATAAPVLPPLVAAPVAEAPVPAPAPRRMPEPPAMEIPAAPVMPAPVAPAPAAPVYETEAPAQPARRRFARPNGAAAQSLSDALNGAFSEAPAAAPPAPVPYTNGHAPHAPAPLPPIDSPFAFAQPPAAAPAPAQRQAAFNPSAFSPTGMESPFALADETLTEATAPHVPQPAPFTFLKPQGDHFAPVNANGAPAAPVAPSAYDALEDTPLPWMQPVGGRR